MASISRTDLVQNLRNQVTGSVLTADDPGYDQTRRGWSLTVNHYPTVIVVARNVKDVIAGVQFAAEAGLGVSIQSTGHGIQQPADNALLIITSQMTNVELDAKAQTAKAEAGTMWKHVVEAGAPFGLAPLLGSAPHVGVMGYTLGGGIGWLARRYGLAVDSVIALDIVTPDGTLRHASATENSDLFWGVRGGGGNFGVVTSIEFKLYPVASIYGGQLMYPGESARDVLRFFRDWIKTAPDELTSSMSVMNIPNFPTIPEAMRGKQMVLVQAVYTGDASEGAAQIQKWIDWRAPMQNTFHTMPFTEIGTVSNDPVEPAPGYGSMETLEDFSDEAIEVILRHVLKPGSPIMRAELRHLGGAISRVDPASNAFSNRDAQLFLIFGGIAPTPEVKNVMKAAFQELRQDVKPYIRGSVYQNFMGAGEATNRGKDGYSPETYQRLVALKAKYDPQNLFRYSYQLVPAN